MFKWLKIYAVTGLSCVLAPPRHVSIDETRDVVRASP